MARETIGYSKLEWVCPNCGGKNPGPQKTCVTCGSPQPENVKFQAPERDELVENSEKEKASAGSDIHCPYCGTRNAATAAVCSQCSGDLKGGAKRVEGRVVGALQTAPPAEVNCPSCGSPNPDTEVRCGKCGAQLKSAAQLPPAPSTNKGKPAGLLIVLGIIAIVIAFGCFWLFSQSSKRSDLSATVQSVAWQRSIIIEKFGPVSKQDWKDSLPPQATLGSCEWREHHTQDEPTDNAEKVCGTPYKIDKGNGYAEVVQDCQYKVKLEYCQYKVNAWTKFDEAVSSGSDLNPLWPNTQLTDKNLRIGEKSETFTVNLNTGDKVYDYHPNAAEFNQFNIGSQWKIVVNGFDQIISVEP
jgi:DNA-directed RNA polymerase subunit RPC12/RpoP